MDEMTNTFLFSSSILFFSFIYIYISICLNIIIRPSIYHFKTMTSYDTLSPSKFTKHVIYQLCLGFSCAIRGFILSWNNPCKLVFFLLLLLKIK